MRVPIDSVGATALITRFAVRPNILVHVHQIGEDRVSGLQSNDTTNELVKTREISPRPEDGICAQGPHRGVHTDLECR